MRTSGKNSLSVSIDFIRVLLAKVDLSPTRRERLLHECHIPSNLINERDARVTLVQYAELERKLIDLTNDELIGHGESRLPVGSIAILTHWLMGANTLRDAALRIAEFLKVIDKGQPIKAYSDGEGQKAERFYFEIELAARKTELFNHADVFIAEFCFATVHRLLSWLTLDIIPIEQVEAQWASPHYAADYQLMFYGAPMRFESKKTRLCFDPKELERPVQRSMSHLAPFLANLNYERLILDFNADNLAAKVAALLRADLKQNPNLPEMAESLGLQSHTLQRILEREGVTYLAIKNQVKRDAAIEMLVNTSLSIEAISEALGFSEVSPFSRVFKKWTGVPPSMYRKPS